MMRRLVVAAALIAGASVASAQLPPSIRKPIEAAKKSVNATNAQTAQQQVNLETPPAPSPQAKPPVEAVSPSSQGQRAPAAKAPASVGQAAKTKAADASKVTFEREVFTYVASEIDPFASPIETGAIRPLVADLKVVGIIYDPTGHNSVAVMRDQSTTMQYRAKVGQVLGRAKVTQIKPQEVVLTIDEYGFSRQESLRLNVQQTQQTKGKP